MELLVKEEMILRLNFLPNLLRQPEKAYGE